MTRTKKFITATVVALAAIAPLASSAQAAGGHDDDRLPPDISACEFWGNCESSSTN